MPCRMCWRQAFPPTPHAGTSEYLPYQMDVASGTGTRTQTPHNTANHCSSVVDQHPGLLQDTDSVIDEVHVSSMIEYSVVITRRIRS